jgi:hypothetical protein
VREMHADLMAKRALHRELDEREALILSKHAVACAGELGVTFRRLVLEDAYAARISAVRAEQCPDLALRGQAAAGNGQVALLDQGGLEQGASRLEGGLIARSQHDARGLVVQAMYQAGLAFAKAHAVHLRVARQQGGGERARLRAHQRGSR